MNDNKFYEEFEVVVDEAVEEIMDDVMGGLSLRRKAENLEIDSIDGELSQAVIEWVDSEHIDLIDAVGIIESASYVVPHESDILTKVTPREGLIFQAQDTLHAHIWDGVVSEFETMKEDTLDEIDERIEELETIINNRLVKHEEQDELNKLFDLMSEIDGIVI